MTPFEWADAPNARDRVSDENVERLLKHWRQVLDSRGGHGAFSRRLDSLGLTEDSVVAWMTPKELTVGASLPAWSEVLMEVDSDSECLAPAGLHQWTPRERTAYGLDKEKIPTFAEWLHPFVTCAMARISAEALAAISAESQGHGMLARSILLRLSHLASRVLAREIERLGQKVPVDADVRRDVLLRYPALSRLLCEGVLTCAQSMSEMLERAAQDRSAISNRFLEGQDAGKIETLIPWRSDAHDGARTATFVRFSSGLELVYKPRSHDIDVAFARLVADLSGNGEALVRLPHSLACGDYGWSERLPDRNCVDAQAVQRYWRRQGVNAACFHFLCGMDFHYENFIAYGEWPVPIDLEAILTLGRHLEGPEARQLPPQLAPIGMSSVLATSMATYWRSSTDDQSLFVASGIGGCGDRLWPQKMPVWEGSPGQPHLRWRRRRYAYQENLPRLDGVFQSLDAEAIESVANGFRSTYALFRENSERLLARDGLLQAFKTCRTRVVLRDTAEYASNLFYALAPDHLVSGLAYTVAIDSLAQGDLPHYENLPEAVVLAEDRNCLLAQDIPAWHSTPESKFLLGPSGKQYGPAAQESALDQACQRVANASEEDCEFQAQLLRVSLLASVRSPAKALDEKADIALPPGIEFLTGWTVDTRAMNVETKEGPEPRAAALALAREIGETLGEFAMRVSDGCSWLGLCRVAGSHTQIAPVIPFPWTSSGSAGTAVLFANLFKAFGDPEYETLARKALHHESKTHARVSLAPWWPRVPISAYSGTCFPIYAYLEVGRLLGDPELETQALTRARTIPLERLAAEKNPDWLGGLSGVVAVMTLLHRRFPLADIRDRVLTATQTISSSASEGGRNGFQVPGFERPLLGMAHGAAGIAAACSLAYAEFGDTKSRSLAVEAFEFERSLFDNVENDWPDFRNPEGPSGFMTGWCGGPAGAALARLIAKDCGVGDSLESEIRTALDRTQARMGIDRHHVCCGDAGRILVLSEAAAKLGSVALEEKALEAVGQLEKFNGSRGYLRQQEFSEAAWTPGLLDGAAGVALAALAASGPGHSNPLSLNYFGGSIR